MGIDFTQLITDESIIEETTTVYDLGEEDDIFIKENDS